MKLQVLTLVLVTLAPGLNSYAIRDDMLPGDLLHGDEFVPGRSDEDVLRAVMIDDLETTLKPVEIETTVIPVPDPEGVRVSENDDFAVFGSLHRPVFPPESESFIPEDSSLLQQNNGHRNSFPGTPSSVNVDVHLAQLADIRVESSNDSIVNVFVANDGLNCSCGISKQTRIVNGEPVKINELPWTVALFRKTWLGWFNKKPYCGGTLINSRYVLTASHCVENMSPGSIKARLYEEDLVSLDENSEGQVEVTVSKIIVHKNYNRRSIDNDIALIQLSEPVNMTGLIVPACLPAEDRELEKQTATVAGWGSKSEGGSQSQVLLKVDVPIINNYDCSTKTVYKGKITPNMLCAGYLDEGKKDACQGDSGGPLIIQNGDRKTLVGIVSWGYGCARPKSPGVYARVGRYAQWILENTKDAAWCSA